MCRGKTPTVQRGPSKGDQLSVDHIIPRTVCSELDKVIANLESMPLWMNERKTDRVVARQVEMARKLNKAGLLSDKGLKAVENSVRGDKPDFEASPRAQLRSREAITRRAARTAVPGNPRHYFRTRPVLSLHTQRLKLSH